MDEDVAYSVAYYTWVWKDQDAAKVAWTRSMMLAQENGKQWQVGTKLAWEDAHDLKYRNLPPGRLLSHLANQVIHGGSA
jgi:hypothetical protein